MRSVFAMIMIFAASIVHAQSVAVPTRGTTWEFPTAVTVNARNYNTAKETFGAGNRTVIVPAGTYLVGALEIFSNTVVLLEPGAVIKDSGVLPFATPLIKIRGNNVRIIGHGARVIAKRSDYTTGEHRAGILIFGASNVHIEGLESSFHGGDGFYIGGPAGDPSTDISITGCLADGNRRQGMSIVNAARVYVADCEFRNTVGTWPMFGVDVEPNNPGDYIERVYLIRPETANNRGGGITVGLSGFGATGRPASVVIDGHRSAGEVIVFQRSSIRAIDSVVYQ